MKCVVSSIPRLISRASRFLNRKSYVTVLAAVIGLALVSSLPSAAQTVSSTLNGTVKDSSGAVVPGANVILLSESTGQARATVSSGTGDFTFPAVLPGSYTITVSKAGFASWSEKGINVNQGESRNIPNIKLQIGKTGTTINVTAASLPPVPMTNGASSTTLNNKMVSQIAIQGRDAAELIRLMPAMAMNTGLTNAQWNSQLTQINTGPAGAFSASGSQPNGGMQLTMDGSVILDAGNQGTQIANVNQDQTQEVTIMNAAFDAEYAHGPGVFTAVGKRGGAKYHGEGYYYMRNGALNAEDSFAKAQGVKKPIDHESYPGFNIGGPVPTGSFLRHKVFFFAGYEYMMQHPVPTTELYMVPTAAMRQGDFSNIGAYSNLWTLGNTPCGSSGGPWCGTTQGKQISGGVIPTNMLDPNAMSVVNLMPMPNADPTQHGGNNFIYQDYTPVDSSNVRARGDIDFTQNTHAYVSWTYQPETDINNRGIWWTANGGTLPYPTPADANQKAKDWSFSLTHVFSPTLTNETTFGYAYFINPILLQNPSAVNPSNVGYNGYNKFTNTANQIPNVYSWTNMPGFFMYPQGASWQPNGAFGKDSYTPSFDDNVTWIVGSHSFKFGGFWAAYANVQVQGSPLSGPEGTWFIDPSGGNPGTTGNALADLEMGHAGSFTQTNQNPVDHLKYNEAALYAQDQWKASARLTVNYGVRFEHEGQWYPFNSGAPGIAYFSNAALQSAIASNCSGFQGPVGSATAVGNCNVGTQAGLVWHAMDPNVPISAYGSRSLLPDPRIGVAYDIHGNGRTVVRGGFGIYRYQLAANNASANNAVDLPLNEQVFSTNCVSNSTPYGIIGFSANANAAAGNSYGMNNCTAGASAPSYNLGIGGMAMNDYSTPYNQNWDVIVDQAAPFHSLLEVEYTGSRSRDMLVEGSLANVDLIQPGTLNSATCNYQVATNCPTNMIPYMPLPYSSVTVQGHGSYSNYNGLIVQWQKQTGPATFNINYTWSHTLGIWDSNSSNGQQSGVTLDPFNMAANYGDLGFDRRHILNASYVINLPSLTHNALLGQVVNGWQLSGVTTFQSGPPLQPLSTNGDFNINYGALPGNTLTQGSVNVLGTNAEPLMPVLVCNPAANLQPGQYFNPNCFNAPSNGQQGDIVWPRMSGPAFFDSDLGLYKNFRVTESQALQFRVTAFNFLNHPLPQFGMGGYNDLQVSLTQPGTNALTTTNTNTFTTGKPGFTTGRRVLELALKYTF